MEYGYSNTCYGVWGAYKIREDTLYKHEVLRPNGIVKSLKNQEAAKH